MINVILNILWLVFGGICMAIGWFVAGAVMVITVVGIPFARASFNLGIFLLWPFGRRVVEREDVTGQDDIGTGSLGTLGNVLWLLLAGIWLAIAHVILAFALAVTIIGIPFAWQHMKFAGFALWPIGRSVVDRDDAEASPFKSLEPKRSIDLED